MEQQFYSLIARDLNLGTQQVKHTIQLLDEGATIPFISRYRKEMTGSLDEVQIANISSNIQKYRNLAHRKEYILTTIEEQGKLTPELKAKIEAVWDADVLEDLYLPYKPKRRTRAEIARQNGLEPLANIIMKQQVSDPLNQAHRFINEQVPGVEDAVQGALDIIAERVSENERARAFTRNDYKRATIVSKAVKGKEEEAQNFKSLFDWSEPISHCSSHRYLAMMRGQKMGYLKVGLQLDESRTIASIERLYIKSNGDCAALIKKSITDGYKRLIKPSIEAETLATLKLKSDAEAVHVFASNLNELLLSPPLGSKRVMGIDPGFRTGCKVVCLDEQGNLQHYEAIYPHPPHGKYQEAMQKIKMLAEQYRIEAVAIGNGTAGRETEEMVRSISFKNAPLIFSVSEDGASVYSASELARKEFPQHDVTVRGAVSIARRLVDPLSELVKIDSKSIGVGQYQHDVDQLLLQSALRLTTESCVNKVGVDLNTASPYLLCHISGLGPALAENIVEYRTRHKGFTSRKQLLEVKRLGAKAYEQCAGFLRISAGENPLDATCVHPERYALVQRMAADAGLTLPQFIAQKELRHNIDLQSYVTPDCGLPTLTDVMEALDKPNRDPRGPIQVNKFDEKIRSINDLREGMQLYGQVENITNFGCFVNLGIHESGLVHVSQLAHKYITNVQEVVHLGQWVKVKVMSVDVAQKRISLSMKEAQ